jgi:hypothetical protein
MEHNHYMMAVPCLRQLVAMQARIRPQASPGRICGGQSGIGTGFSLSTSVCALSLSFHQCSIFIINPLKTKRICFI